MTKIDTTNCLTTLHNLILAYKKFYWTKAMSHLCHHAVREYKIVPVQSVTLLVEIRWCVYYNRKKITTQINTRRRA
jgi:hypothetical protein